MVVELDLQVQVPNRMRFIRRAGTPIHGQANRAPVFSGGADIVCSRLQRLATTARQRPVPESEQVGHCPVRASLSTDARLC